MSGPLTGLRVLEVAAIGPVPFAGMMLSDMGADVVRLDRPPTAGAEPFLTPIDRGRRSAAIDLKSRGGAELALDLIAEADILLEGFRPGVMERLGLGPETCLARNPRLIYGRMTGYGQSGPLAQLAGHDINYIAITGALDLIGPADGPPLPPLNLVGDFGGGGMLLAFGVLAALHRATGTGEGEVVDASMTDGVSALTAMFHGMRASGHLGPRGSNGLDGGAPYYRTYETSDGKWMAVGAIEPQFYSALLAGLDLDPDALPAQGHRRQWPVLHQAFADAFRTRSREEWSRVFTQVDACVSPVLAVSEVGFYDHHVARSSFSHDGDNLQPAPAPRMSAAPGDIQGPPPAAGQHTVEVLRDWGVPADTAAAALRDHAAWSQP